MSTYDKPRAYAPPHPATTGPQPEDIPVYDAEVLTADAGRAEIVLDDKHYTLRITKAGKLILTK